MRPFSWRKIKKNKWKQEKNFRISLCIFHNLLGWRDAPNVTFLNAKMNYVKNKKTDRKVQFKIPNWIINSCVDDVGVSDRLKVTYNFVLSESINPCWCTNLGFFDLVLWVKTFSVHTVATVHSVWVGDMFGLLVLGWPQPVLWAELLNFDLSERKWNRIYQWCECTAEG